MEAHLVVLEGKHLGAKVRLPATQFVIGRDPSCHLRPVSTDVSKFHCAIARMGNRVLLRDLNSTNGTFLNDQPVSGTTAVHNGDVLRVGPLQFRIQTVEPADQLSGSDSNIGWLLRNPDEQENRVLDAASETTILPVTLFDATEPTPTPHATPAASENATIVAGDFLREYLAARPRPPRK